MSAVTPDPLHIVKRYALIRGKKYSRLKRQYLAEDEASQRDLITAMVNYLNMFDELYKEGKK